jgi:hypothetical protein
MTALSHFKNGMQGVGIANISYNLRSWIEELDWLTKPLGSAIGNYRVPNGSAAIWLGKRDLMKGRYAQ